MGDPLRPRPRRSRVGPPRRAIGVALAVGVVALLAVGLLPRSAAPPSTPTRPPIIPTVDLSSLPRGPIGVEPSVSFTSGTRAVSLATRVVPAPAGGIDQVPGLAGLAPDRAVVITFPAPQHDALAPPKALPDAVFVYVGVDGRVTAVQRPGDPGPAQPYQAVVVARTNTPNLGVIQPGLEVRAPGIDVARPSP